MAPDFPLYDAKVAHGLEGAADAAGGLVGFLGIHHTEVGPGLLRAELTVRHLTAAKPDRGFYFIAVRQPLSRALHPVLVIVIVGTRAKLHFVDGDRDLLLLRLVCLLLRFVLVFSKVDDPANRGIGVRSNLDEIQTFLAGSTDGIAHIHHAELFSFLANHAYFRYANSLVNANRG